MLLLLLLLLLLLKHSHPFYALISTIIASPG